MEKKGLSWLKKIKDPSEKIQIVAVEHNPYAIQHLKNPTEKAQIVAVEKNPWVIGIIEKPTDKVKELANKLKNKK